MGARSTCRTLWRIWMRWRLRWRPRVPSQTPSAALLLPRLPEQPSCWARRSSRHLDRLLLLVKMLKSKGRLYLLQLQDLRVSMESSTWRWVTNKCMHVYCIYKLISTYFISLVLHDGVAKCCDAIMVPLFYTRSSTLLSKSRGFQVLQPSHEIYPVCRNYSTTNPFGPRCTFTCAHTQGKIRQF